MRDPYASLADAVVSSVGLCVIGLPATLAPLAPLLRGAGATVYVGAQQTPVDAAVLTADFLDQGRPAVSPHCGDPSSIFVVGRAAPGGVISRQSLEAEFIAAGYRKHPATTSLFGFEGLAVDGGELWAVFERRQPATAKQDARLRAERDLHADMLREPGVRSDAHLVRYDLAARLVRPNDIVLDAACGLGYGTHILASLSEAGSVIGIDASDWAVDYATRQFGSARTEFRKGMLPEALRSIEDASVDCVISLETLEHVEDPGALLAAFFRVLKPGGRLFVSVPNDWADETGRDPNPHHLHVYDWHKLRAQLSQHFTVDAAWRLIASGCKSGERRVWTARPRLIEQIPLALADAQDAEWWLASAVKPPLPDKSASYRQTVHGLFEGRTHLVDFEQHYANPWLVHSLVEIPWRVQDGQALRALAESVAQAAPSGSPDAGASLAVRGWRLVEERASHEALTAWLAQWQQFVADVRTDNPHSRRWLVSLAYLAGRLQELHGDAREAQRCYEEVLRIDVRSITPTLGTKSADAAFRLGVLRWAEQQPDAARKAWQAGLDTASACLHEDWIEFVGNAERPFAFSLNDAVETLDCGVRCALALRATSFGWSRGRVARELAQLRNRSLRSAVSRLQSQLTAITAESKRTAFALVDAQSLALRRADEAASLAASLATTQAALEDVQRLAWARADELRAADERLSRTQTAHGEAQRLATDRARELGRMQALHTALAAQLAEAAAESSRLQAALDAAQQLAIERFEQIKMLDGRLGDTQSALNQTQDLAVARAHEIDRISAVLDETTTLALARFAETQSLASRLDQTQVALDATQQLARERFSAIESLTQQLDSIHQELGRAQELAVWRADEIDRRAAAFAAKQAALEAAAHVIEDRERQLDSARHEIDRLKQGLHQALDFKQTAETLASELSATRANLASADEARRQGRRERDLLAQELYETRAALAEEAGRNQRITKSLYWRAGAPLRWLAGLINGASRAQ